jgi:hypothetical protein
MHTVSIFRYPNMRTLPSDKYLAQLVKAWTKFYRENSIDFVIMGLMDDYPGFIGMEVAKSMKIPVIVPYAGGRFTLSYLLTDADYMPIFYKKLKKEEVSPKFDEAVSAMNKEGVTNKSISDLADSYFNLLMLSTVVGLLKAVIRSFRTYYFKLPDMERRIWLSPPELINRQLWYFVHSKFSRLFFNKKPVEGEKFVFFPLHFSEDAALKAVTPLVNQVRLVQEIAKVLPHDTVLYVKPHPHWKCSDLSIREMVRLNKVPNLRLLDYNCSTKNLIKDSEYVVIINSSVGFEALVQNKKVVSFGSGYPPEVMPRLASVEKLANINKIQMDELAYKEFVANTYHHCIYHDNQEKFNVGAWTMTFSKKLFDEIVEAYKYLKENPDWRKVK